MALKATAKAPGGNGSFEVPDEGNHPAVLVAIVDLGTHKDDYDGAPRDVHKVQLVWELTTQEKNDKENHVIGRDYNLALSEKSNLGQLITGWTGKKFATGEDFDITQLIGKSCLLSVVHGTAKKSGKTFARVAGASAIPKKKDGKPLIEVPPPKHKPVVWEIEGSDSLPEHLTWLPYIIGEPPLEVIRQSKEWKAKLAGTASAADEGSIDETETADIPF